MTQRIDWVNAQNPGLATLDAGTVVSLRAGSGAHRMGFYGKVRERMAVEPLRSPLKADCCDDLSFILYKLRFY